VLLILDKQTFDEQVSYHVILIDETLAGLGPLHQDGAKKNEQVPEN
jgi:hypothetical protein